MYWLLAKTLLIGLMRSEVTKATAKFVIRQATASLVRHIRNGTRETFRKSVEHISG